LERIAIIGLGLIGGSIGLGLKRAGLKDIEIVGTSYTRRTLEKARKAGAIDVEARAPAEAARGARLVIVASPIATIPEIFQEIAPVLEPGTVVTDVASTSGQVMRWAREYLPDHAQFVGGHPMAGKETQGFDAADPDLFVGKSWVVTPAVDSVDAAVSTVVGLARTLGARPVFMDAEEHDSYVAAISHLPLVLAEALFSVARDSAAWPELAQLASSGFRDTTRLASGSPEMAHDIMTTNRENIVHWIDRIQDELYRVRQIVERGDSKEVLELFTRAQLERETFITAGPPRRETDDPPRESIGLSDLLLGSRVSEVLRKQESMLQRMERGDDRKRR
jgi:prephenate dehydrogenase